MFCYAFTSVCTDLSGKEPHGQVGVGRMVTAGSPHGVIVSTVAQNARDVAFWAIPAPGTFPIPITLNDTRIGSFEERGSYL